MRFNKILFFALAVQFSSIARSLELIESLEKLPAGTSIQFSQQVPLRKTPVIKEGIRNGRKTRVEQMLPSVFQVGRLLDDKEIQDLEKDYCKIWAGPEGEFDEGLRTLNPVVYESKKETGQLSDPLKNIFTAMFIKEKKSDPFSLVCYSRNENFTSQDLSLVFGMEIIFELPKNKSRRAEEKDFSAVGAIVTTEGQVCTGTIIQQNQILTARHCLHFKSDKEPRGLYYYPNWRADLSRDWDNLVKTETVFKLEVKFTPQGEKYANDWALLEAKTSKDAKSLEERFGVIPISKRERTTQDWFFPVVLVGYPLGERQVQLERRLGKYEEETGVLLHGCEMNSDSELCRETERGHSGAPLLAWVGNRWEIIGIHIRGSGALKKDQWLKDIGYAVDVRPLF